MEPFEELEQKFGQWAGVDNVVGCASGTAALHLALESFKIPPGGEVIVPDYAMIACARACTLAGLKPVFVDVNPKTLLIDTDKLRDAVTPNTWAVMTVHTYGRRCDMDAIHRTAAAHDLYVVEDLAEAHGVKPHAGTDAACWSFYKNKIVFGEEGGAVAFGSKWEAGEVRRLRSLGFTAAHDYWHTPRGHNYRLSNAHASLILSSLAGSYAFRQLRAHHVGLLDEYLPREGWRQPSREANWVYDLRIPNLTVTQQRMIVEALREVGVPARYGFRPLSLQLEYLGRHVTPEEARLDVDTESARAAREVIYLQIGQSAPLMNRDGVRLAFKTIEKFV